MSRRVARGPSIHHGKISDEDDAILSEVRVSDRRIPNMLRYRLHLEKKKYSRF